MKNLHTFEEFLNESTEPIGVAVYVKHFEDASGEGAGWTSAAQVDVYSEDHLKSLKSQNLEGFKFFRKTRGSAPIVFRYTQELQKTIR
jgi:hypothetical protein